MCDAGGTVAAAYVAAFAADIETKLKLAVDRHIAKVEAIERGPDFALASEREAHDLFRAEKLKDFVGRESNLSAIADYLSGEDTHPLVLHGRSGTGKSALMARASKAAVEAGRARSSRAS